MTTPKIAFIDHPFHRKTRSSNFFVELLSETFVVHLFYLDPDPRSTMREIADSDYDLVVCWQTEFCAPYFLTRGKRVVCVPMFDGVETAPDWYWLSMRQARFINFSEKLHLLHKSLGIESIYAKYFGVAKMDLPQAKFGILRGFFWQRRPEDGLHYKFARSVLGSAVTALHIHNAPDTQSAEDWKPDWGCTVSHFNDDASEYRKALEASNVFLSPRRTEGIGHPLIEAMARGMCVIAHDKPTANEYIIDGVNGILVDYDSPASFEKIKPSGSKDGLTLARAELLGKTARAFYLKGCEDWEETSKLLPYFVQTTPSPDLTDRDVKFADQYLSITRFAHRDFYRFLHNLLRLQGKGFVGAEASAIRHRERIKWAIKSLPGAVLLWRVMRRVLRGFR